ncbi:hypothetical protein [Pseudomonas sp. NPDC089569]|uniref:hypothetical protein n=1 Tax=Pseudomonas sp. NPDC089569 TaxID=3390722 RepID=UPI003D0347BD
MSLARAVAQLMSCGRWLGLLAVLGAPGAQAVTQEIRALFTPDPANPQNNSFINKTPESGYCLDNPVECRNNKTFSIRLPITFRSVTAIQPGAIEREGPMFRTPAQWRALTVTNTQTGESEQVEFRIAGIGSQYVLSDTAANLTGAASALEGHQNLWGGPGHSWVYAPANCQYSGVGFYGDSYYRFFWKTPTPSICAKTASFLIPEMSYNYLDFAYELRTPNPLGMSSGQYTGTMSYRIGSGGDFDMGDNMQPDDPDLTLDFVLDVQHTLKVDIPPGGEKVQLVPAGGWQSWLQAGRKPVRLFRDQTFHISVSSRFKMHLICEISGLYDCMIRDPVSQRAAAVTVAVSLPKGLMDLQGQPVERRPLRLGQNNAQQFQPGIYVDRGPGILHFEISPSYVDYITRPGVASSYSGDITVIWDSEV